MLNVWNITDTIHMHFVKSFIELLGDKFMGKASVKENKNVYQQLREKCDLTRAAASEKMTGIPPEKIERIESEKVLPHPEDVLEMAKAYKEPQLCNHYCANECPIGRVYVPEIKIKDLSQIVLEMLASLNAMKKSQEMLIDITADGVIDDDELKDFIKIQNELERISITVETLQLWTEQMIVGGKINIDKYNALKE